MRTIDSMMKAMGYKPGQWDYSLPQSWFDKATDMGINPRQFVWVYDDKNPLGAPMNVSAAYLNWVEQQEMEMDMAMGHPDPFVAVAILNKINKKSA